MARILYDGIVILFFCVLTGVPAVITGISASWLGVLPNLSWWRWALIPPGVLAFLILLLLTASVIRCLLPRLRTGEYRFPRHPQAVVWLLHFALQRMIYLPLWKHFLFSFSTLRWGALHALGGKAAFDMDMSSDVLILDLPLMEVEANTMIGAGCTLSGHIIENERIFLGRISMGKGVQVGSNVLIGPATSISDHTIVGAECRVAREVSIGQFVYLGAACYLGSGVTIGDNAVLGHHVDIESDVSIGAGAVIQSGARLSRGTVIADGEHFPRRAGSREA